MGVKQNIWSNDFRVLKIVTGFLVILILLTHCATKPDVIPKEDEREILRNRIKEYWQYRINGNVDRAYQCEIPAYREKFSLLEYVDQFKFIRYLEADISEINIEGEKGKALVSVTHMMNLKYLQKKRFKKLEEERWVKIQKIWFHIPQGFEM
jgi:hypothetical protein